MHMNITGLLLPLRLACARDGTHPAHGPTTRHPTAPPHDRANGAGRRGVEVNAPATTWNAPQMSPSEGSWVTSLELVTLTALVEELRGAPRTSSLWTVDPEALRHPPTIQVEIRDVVKLGSMDQLMYMEVTGSMARGYTEGRMGASHISDIGSTVASLAKGRVLASCTATAHPPRAETGWIVLGMRRVTRVAEMLVLLIFVLILVPRVVGKGVGGGRHPRFAAPPRPTTSPRSYCSARGR